MNNKQVLIKSTKFSDVDACLKSLKINQLYSIQKIINTILQIDNFHKNSNHIGLDDIRDSIEELRYYRKTILKL